MGRFRGWFRRRKSHDNVQPPKQPETVQETPTPAVEKISEEILELRRNFASEQMRLLEGLRLGSQFGKQIIENGGESYVAIQVLKSNAPGLEAFLVREWKGVKPENVERGQQEVRDSMEKLKAELLLLKD